MRRRQRLWRICSFYWTIFDVVREPTERRETNEKNGSLRTTKRARRERCYIASGRPLITPWPSCILSCFSLLRHDTCCLAISVTIRSRVLIGQHYSSKPISEHPKIPKTTKKDKELKEERAKERGEERKKRRQCWLNAIWRCFHIESLSEYENRGHL